VHDAVAEQARGERERLVRAVEDAEFHELVGAHVRDDEAGAVDGRRRSLPFRPAVGELVLDDPEEEILADHRALIDDPELGLHGRGARRRCPRRDAVHHAAWESDLGLDPGAEVLRHRRRDRENRRPR